MNIGFIGFGNIAKALAARLHNTDRYTLYASSPRLSEKTYPFIHGSTDNTWVAQKADCLIIAVKPAKVRLVLEEIAHFIHKDTVIISLATGIPLQTLNALSTPNQPIVRAMPNTPVSIGEGATALIHNAQVSPTQKHLVETLFSTTGKCTWVSSEAEMDALTALSGSGPAYVFLFAQALTKAGVAIGIPQALAQEFTIQTLRGASALMEQSGETPEELRKKVTAEGGTTAAAINILENHQFEEIIKEAVHAANARAKILATH